MLSLGKGAKQPKGMQTRSTHEGERRGEHHIAAPARALLLELDGALLSIDASIWDFQGGMAGYVANSVEQSLLLPTNVVDLRSMR